MSVQFGIWNFDGKPATCDDVERIKNLVAPYSSDGRDFYAKDSVAIIYSAFHTTKESRLETQPHICRSGAVLTWDGRLDNRAELIDAMTALPYAVPTDISIVAAAYENWGSACLKWLIGDWALSIWNPNDRSLMLAKDPIGVRHLYYSFNTRSVVWSTILDPLIRFAPHPLVLNGEYIAGWLSSLPAAHLTPFLGIRAVPASSLVVISPEKQTTRRYWDFDASKQIRYTAEAQYEEHFRAVFAESVRARLRSDSPIMAELSGGLDSSSIVCMADTLIDTGVAETRRLDTLSYYDDSEPNWDERPYFAKVEEKRGRTGCHIDVGSPDPSTFHVHSNQFAATPGGLKQSSDAARQFSAYMRSQGNRVLLSGIGGDEVMGGVPTPTPELANLLANAEFGKLASQLGTWALSKRKPWFHLLSETICEFLPSAFIANSPYEQSAAWLSADFAKRHRIALGGYRTRLRLLGPRPSFQINLSTLEALRRQLACSALPSELLYEKRYPYLDRRLLEFIYAIPREQLVRPGQRRSLMRRALRGMVPDEILERKRKAFVSRQPLATLASNWSEIDKLSGNLLCAQIGIVESEKFLHVLQRARHGIEAPVIRIMRTLGLEFWLRTLEEHRLLDARDVLMRATPKQPGRTQGSLQHQVSAG